MQCRHVYSSLLVACAHSRGTGYNLPPSTVAAAEQLLEEMQAHGIPRDFTVLSISLDVYAKAGMCASLSTIVFVLVRCPGHTLHWIHVAVGSVFCAELAQHIMVPTKES